MPEHKLNHLAIIPDGNTRWAKANNVSPYEGYRAGIKRGLDLIRHTRTLGIHTATFWGLSTENWRSRPKMELEFLVRLFVDTIDEWLEEATAEGIKIIHLGNKTRLPKILLAKIADAEAATRHNTAHVFNIGLDYGGQDELVRAVARRDAAGGAGSLEDYLDTAGQPHPNPDFVVRTSGEQRTSGFMPWQAVYAELFFEPVLFPDFTNAKLDDAVADYYRRQRRFGGGH